MIFSCVKLLYRRKLKNQQASRPRTGCCCSRCGGPFRPISQPIKIARAVPSPLGRMLKASCRGAAASEAPSPPRAAADPRATRHPWVAAPVASGCPPVRLARVRPPTFPRTARSHRLAASSCARPRLAAGPFHALLDLRHTILRPQVNALSLERNIEPYHAVQFEGNY